MAKILVKKYFLKIMIFSVLGVLGSSCTFAQDAVSTPGLHSNFSPMDFMDTNTPVPSKSEVSGTVKIDSSLQNSSEKSGVLDVNESFDNLKSAMDKFTQCNIRASWEDFKATINAAPDNDFIYIAYANKMADLGFFDLANLSVSKIKDQALAGVSVDAMKRFYYPRRKLKLEDELFLAEAYSNILYNNQSSEATNELLKNDALLSTSDYANYLVALGSYKSNFFSNASKYINIAILQNPSNLNYQKLKAEILAENDDAIEAMKVVDNLKKQDLYSSEYERKINSLEQFVLYKTKKAQGEKNYHLGYYYYLDDDDAKAIRTLQSVLNSKKRGNNGLVYSLMSEIYLDMDEFEKAADTAKKAYKIDKNSSKALMTLGNLRYQDKDYKHALEYYKTAANRDKKNYNPLIKEALAYKQLSNLKKSKEIYIKVLKNYSNSWEAYYNVALLDKDKRTIYLKKALAVNPLYEAAWIELAKDAIDDGKLNMAQQYLSNAHYIDENDFRYYYYQGLINKNLGDSSQAEINFKKCLKINSNFKEAQNELNTLLEVHEKQQMQDGI